MNEENYKEYKRTVRHILGSHMEDARLGEYIDKLRSEEVIGIMPASFYRYRPFNQYTLSEIINQHIFLSPIKNLDDKLDSKYVYTLFGGISNPDEEGIFDPRREETKKKIAETNKEFCDHLRIACLTQDYKNIPMWYYYAQGHQGICIKYSIKDFNNEDIFLPVIYPSKRKKESNFKFFPTDKQKKCGAVFNSIVKDESWKFEKEWRIIQYVNDMEKHYVNWRMSEIYFGCDAYPETIKTIKNIIEKNGLKISMHQMELSTMGLTSHVIE